MQELEGPPLPPPAFLAPETPAPASPTLPASLPAHLRGVRLEPAPSSLAKRSKRPNSASGSGALELGTSVLPQRAEPGPPFQSLITEAWDRPHLGSGLQEAPGGGWRPGLPAAHPSRGTTDADPAQVGTWRGIVFR